MKSILPTKSILLNNKLKENILPLIELNFKIRTNKEPKKLAKNKVLGFRFRV